MNYIDVRSDTVTWPTPAMREAMANAAVGDDVYGDDPTVKELEAYAASISGKEAALFVPSGTFGNQLAIFTHCARGAEVILDERCHIVQHEAGAPGVIAGVQLRAVDCGEGTLTANLVAPRVRFGNDIHEPKTGLICLENAHSNGRTMSLSDMEGIKRCADRNHLPIHLDGARLFNAATALGVQAKDITQYADSVMFCLSKGLCAPVGSMLAGSRKFAEEARRKRKLMGGGLRQAGILAAAGLVALKDMRHRLDEDHANAKRLAAALSEIPGAIVDPKETEINMAFFGHERNDSIDSEAFVEFMRGKGILVNPTDSAKRYRFVTHYWIKREDIDTIAKTVREFYS
jgi:threonine aldolase